MAFFSRIIDRIKFSFISIKIVFFYLITKILIIFLILISKNTVFVTGNIFILFKSKVVAAERESLSIYNILYNYLCD